MNKALFILGPTGVGKTALGLELASKFQGNILSIDSVQVYKGLDVISGKDLPSKQGVPPQFSDISKQFSSLSASYAIGFYDFNTIPVFLLDIVQPTFNFSVSNFLDCALPITDFIVSKDKLPVFVGGTGLYSKALLEGIDTESILPDLELREKLEKLSLEELVALLQKQNLNRFEQMTPSDKKNKRRIIRSLEILKSDKIDREVKKLEGYDVFRVGLFCERNKLRERIEKRVLDRIKNGALVEAEDVFKNCKNLSPQVKNANGYKQLFEYFEGKTSHDEAIEKWKISEYRHAKNQMTWFRKDKSIHWFDILEVDFQKKLEKEVLDWYNK
jgi:tRNA dimethylallyltransferase